MSLLTSFPSVSTHQQVLSDLLHCTCSYAPSALHSGTQDHAGGLPRSAAVCNISALEIEPLQMYYYNKWTLIKIIRYF